MSQRELYDKLMASGQMHNTLEDHRRRLEQAEAAEADEWDGWGEDPNG